jgi:outer membrane protein assembly factor BamB
MRHWHDPAEVELVGDWSAVPAARRGFHELWGMAWDERTLAVNTAAPPIPSEGNQQPHTVGPTAFVADTQNNRVCKLEFSPTNRSAPCKVSEFITGISDPWDVVYYEGILYVSERLSHRIAAYDAITGQYIKTIVSGNPLAGVSAAREVVRLASLTSIRAERCVAPEGLYRVDDWLYFGSKAMAQVRRIDLRTGALETVAVVPTDDNSKFVKFAVSDGTFGPKGTLFTCTFSNAQYGLSASILPNGDTWWWFSNSGGTGQWSEFVYPSAVAIGQGRLLLGGANEGLLMITRRSAGDTELSEAAVRGAQEFNSRGLNLLHGESAFGFYGLPLPWGVSSDIDAFLTAHGHPRT